MAQSAAAVAIAPPADQRVSVNIGALPSSLDPSRARSLDDQIVANAIFTPLYRSAGGSSGQLTPWLASGQPIVSRDGLHVTVRLRTARWTDGRAITASDVVFAFNRARTMSIYGANFTAVRRIVAVGPRTVRFDLRVRVPWFGELLSSTATTPIPARVVRRWGTRWTHLDKIVTSGPFEPFSGRGRSELLLHKSKSFWGARSVRLQRLELRAVPVASASGLFRANRLDVGLRGTSIHPSTISSWLNDPRYRAVSTGAAQYLFINTRDSRLTDARVRRAIALAIDRTALTNLTAKGADQPLESIVPDGIRGFASVVPSGSTLLTSIGLARTSEATTLLSQAGWISSGSLNLYYPADGSAAASVAARIRSDLAAAGIPVTLRGVPITTYAKLGVGISPVGDDVDLLLNGWSPDWSDPSSFHQLFTCANVDAGLNLANWCDTTYDATWAAARAATGASRITLHRQLEQMLTGPTGAFPAVPLYVPVGTMLVQPWVRGLTQSPSGLVAFERIYITRH